MIAPDAKPIANRNPYKRVDLGARRQHPAVITKQEYERGVIPDELLYEYDYAFEVWRLKK